MVGTNEPNTRNKGKDYGLQYKSVAPKFNQNNRTNFTGGVYNTVYSKPGNMKN